MLIFFKVSSPRGIRKTGGKIWLTYEELLKRIDMMIDKIMGKLMRELIMMSIIIMG